MYHDFQLAHHDGSDWPEWSSAPRKPLVEFCGAHKGEWMDSVIGPDAVTGAPMIYHVVRCELCIATHVFPLPDAEALAHYYAHTFYQHDKPAYVERYERDREWWTECVYKPIFAICNSVRHLPSDTTWPRFLDIGAGPGIALDIAQRCGYDTMGIEPNAWLCEALINRGHYMRQGVIDQFTDAQLRVVGEDRHVFDVIMAYEVLEHQPYPEEFLLRCYDLLEDGGLLIVAVPNDYNPLQLAACQQLHLSHYWLAPPQHLFYFTPKTLQLLLRRCGFTILTARATYPMERFLLDGRNYVGNDELGRQCHAERMADELTAVHHGQWIQREQEYAANMTQRVGRELLFIARKNG